MQKGEVRLGIVPDVDLSRCCFARRNIVVEGVSFRMFAWTTLFVPDVMW